MADWKCGDRVYLRDPIEIAAPRGGSGFVDIPAGTPLMVVDVRGGKLVVRWKNADGPRAFVVKSFEVVAATGEYRAGA